MAEKLGDILGPRKPEVSSILGPRNPRTQEDTDRIADYLAQKLESPEYRPVFLKIAWRFSEAEIMNVLEIARERASIPRAYFIKSMKSKREYWA